MESMGFIGFPLKNSDEIAVAAKHFFKDHPNPFDKTNEKWAAGFIAGFCRAMEFCKKNKNVFESKT